MTERSSSSPASPSPAPSSAASPSEVSASAGQPGIFQAFLRLSERFGNMLSRLLLSGMYFLLLGPFALFYRLAADPLHLRRRRRGNWTAWTTHNDSLATARRQD